MVHGQNETPRAPAARQALTTASSVSCCHFCGASARMPVMNASPLVRPTSRSTAISLSSLMSRSGRMISIAGLTLVAPSEASHACQRATDPAIGNGAATGPRTSVGATYAVTEPRARRCFSHGSSLSIGSTADNWSLRADAASGATSPRVSSGLRGWTNNVDADVEPSSTSTAPTSSSSPVRYWKSAVWTKPS